MTDSSKVLVQIALIQISVPDCSYLLDVIALEGIMQDWQWLHLFRLLFCREESIVLGKYYHSFYILVENIVKTTKTCHTLNNFW